MAADCVSEGEALGMIEGHMGMVCVLVLVCPCACLCECVSAQVGLRSEIRGGAHSIHHCVSHVCFKSNRPENAYFPVIQSAARRCVTTDRRETPCLTGYKIHSK